VVEDVEERTGEIEEEDGKRESPVMRERERKKERERERK
jgi:hypothetical protein